MPLRSTARSLAIRAVLPFAASTDVLLFAACTDPPGATAGTETAADSTTAGPSTASSTTLEPTSGAPTGDPPDSTGPAATTEVSDSTTSSSGTTTGASDTTEGTTDDTAASTGGPPGVCPGPCERPEVHTGDVTVADAAAVEAFECVSHIDGSLYIMGDLGAAELAGLARLERVSSLTIENNAALTSLDVFPCLRVIDDWTSIDGAPALTDASMLTQLDTLPSLALTSTGLTALPALGPAHPGLRLLVLNDNHALVDLDPVAGWRSLPGEGLTILLRGNAALTSIEGLAGIIADAGGQAVLEIRDLPQLASLKGLEPLKFAALQLTSLPLVPDLQPLSGLTWADGIVLVDMPLVKNLEGLHNLTTAESLVIGGCVEGEPDGPGMPGLKDLSGLDKLESASTLGLANNSGMTALTGAPALHSVVTLHIVGNDGLTQADADQLLGQLDMQPDDCFGDWGECQCIVFMP